MSAEVYADLLPATVIVAMSERPLHTLAESSPEHPEAWRA